jgi:hypothetical protein
MNVKIFTIAHMPERLGQKWLQHLRDFDTANPECHFEVFNETPDVSMADALRMLRVEPDLTFTKIFERATKK